MSEDDPRSAQAEELLSLGGVLIVQILDEFASVARRKILMSWSDVTEALNAFRVLCPSPLPITIEMHEAARRVSAALEAGCTTLYSEDLHDGQTIEKLTIRNPFVG